MTEAEWMASENPAAMLRAVETWRSMQSHNVATSFVVSNRKLRLWVEACRLEAQPDRVVPWGYDLDDQGDLRSAVEEWADRDDPLLDAATKCSILHCILGNPFRPVTINPAWLTPDVVSLAQAAYEERVGQKCAACVDGMVAVSTSPKSGPYKQAGPKHIYELPKVVMRKCQHCHGTGRIDTGHLDSERLTVLADAMEEAGAEGAILEHLRSPGPHCRGCHAIDAILGKE